MLSTIFLQTEFTYQIFFSKKLYPRYFKSTIVIEMGSIFGINTLKIPIFLKVNSFFHNYQYPGIEIWDLISLWILICLVLNPVGLGASTIYDLHHVNDLMKLIWNSFERPVGNKKPRLSLSFLAWEMGFLITYNFWWPDWTITSK